MPWWAHRRSTVLAGKQVASRVKLELAQYNELLAFAQFGSDLDKATRDQLNRGERIMEILKQPQYSPYKVEEQVLVFYAATHGKLDDIDIEDVRNFEEEMLASAANTTDLLKHIKEKKAITPEIEEEIEEFMTNFKKDYVH